MNKINGLDSQNYDDAATNLIKGAFDKNMDNVDQIKHSIEELQILIKYVQDKINNENMDDETKKRYMQTHLEAITTLKERTEQLNSNIIGANDEILQQNQDIDSVSSEINNKKLRSMQQENIINNKEKLVNTRNRMLQIIEEKNLYKKKIIYTLISLIILITIIILISYSMIQY